MNWIEYHCPCGTNFRILIGKAPICPDCKHVFTHTEVQIDDEGNVQTLPPPTGSVIYEPNPSLPKLEPIRREEPSPIENLPWQERRDPHENIIRECDEIVRSILG